MLFNLKKKLSRNCDKKSCRKKNSDFFVPPNPTSNTASGTCFDRLHQKEKQEFLDLISHTCDTLPPQGEAVLDLFICTEGHVTPEYLYDTLVKQGRNIPLSTINEVLDLLCRYGIAQKVILNGTGPWYEHLHLGSRHDHLVCTKCGKVIEFEDDTLNNFIDKLAGEQQFLPLAHKLNIAGVCPECQQGGERILPLSMTSKGERVKIISFEGGATLKERLNSMGLSVGQVVEVLNNSGPFIVNARNTRIALGKGLAQKVMVSIV